MSTRLATLLAASLSLALAGCPGEEPDAPVDAGSGNTGNKGNNNNNGTDGGASDAGATSFTTGSDAGLAFVARSAVLIPTFEPGVVDIVALASEQGRADFCAGNIGMEPDEYLLLSLNGSSADLTGSYAFGSDATLRLGLPGTGDLTAGGGALEVTSSVPYVRAGGTFSASPLFLSDGGVSEATFSGAFDVTGCPPGPFFSGGSGPNTASGNGGFAVQGSALANFGDTHVIFLMDTDLRDEVCAGASDPSVPVRISAPSFSPFADGGVLGVHDESTATIQILSAFPDGGSVQRVAERLTTELTVTAFDGGFAAGTYATSYLLENGAYETLGGSFAVTACP